MSRELTSSLILLKKNLFNTSILTRLDLGLSNIVQPPRDHLENGKMVKFLIHLIGETIKVLHQLKIKDIVAVVGLSLLLELLRLTCLLSLKLSHLFLSNNLLTALGIMRTLDAKVVFHLMHLSISCSNLVE